MTGATVCHLLCITLQSITLSCVSSVGGKPDDVTVLISQVMLEHMPDLTTATTDT